MRYTVFLAVCGFLLLTQSQGFTKPAAPLSVALFLRGEKHGRKVWADRTMSWPDFVGRCRARLALWDAGPLRLRDEDYAEYQTVDEIDEGSVLTIDPIRPGPVPESQAPPSLPWWDVIRPVGRGLSPHDGLKAWDPWVVPLPNGSFR